MIRMGIATILSTADADGGEAIEVIAEAGNGLEAIDLVTKLQPDVVLMDVQMPQLDGLEATRRITAKDSGAAVLILTTFDRDDFLFDALSAGAAGFLLKTAEAEQLIDAVRVVGRGDALLAPEVTRRVISRFAAGADRAPGTVAESSEPAAYTPTARSGNPAAGAEASSTVPTPEAAAALEQLTGREREIFTLVVHGLSNREIAEQLFLGDATVKTHVSNALMKLHLRDRIQAVIWAYENNAAG